MKFAEKSLYSFVLPGFNEIPWTCYREGVSSLSTLTAGSKADKLSREAFLSQQEEIGVKSLIVYSLPDYPDLECPTPILLRLPNCRSLSTVSQFGVEGGLDGVGGVAHAGVHPQALSVLAQVRSTNPLTSAGGLPLVFTHKLCRFYCKSISL